MLKQIPGLMLFSHYAWACAEHRCNAVKNKLSEEDFEHHRWLIDSKMVPDIVFLERCYRKAMDDYRECQLCRLIGYEADFSYPSVSNHWRHHHGGPTPVSMAIVLEIRGDKVMVISGSKTSWVSNPFKHSLESTISTVFVHNNMIIEIVE
jgi:hypothetical protein